MYSSFFGSWTEAISRISDEPSPENQIDQGSSEASPLNGDSSHVLTWETFQITVACRDRLRSA